jgi:hypothetical protein
VSTYFANFGEGVMQYTCESSDGRALSRSRLFERWLREYDTTREFRLLPFTIGRPKEEGYTIGGFLLRADSPTLPQTLALLEEAIQNISAAKQ